MAYHYSSEDPSFRQYVTLDIVTSLVDEGNYNEAKDIIRIVEQSFDEYVDCSPLLIAKIYLDVFSHNVNDSTLNAISRALESYQGDDPSRIMTIIFALSQQCDDETRFRIENLFNLRKLSIAQKYGKKVHTYLGNIDKFLSFIQQGGNLKNVNLNNAPTAVKGRFFPRYSSIGRIRARIQSLTTTKSVLSVEQFDKFIFLMPALNALENEIIEDVQWANEPQPSNSSFNRLIYN